MSDRENFLDRWSRRKRGEAIEEDARQEAAALPPETAEARPVSTDDADKLPSKEGKAKDEEPVFDLSKLPSIDSITATTDIRMFMLPGVPLALRQAALRKVWVTDPKIRDFIEMAENQWDFTVNSPGFDFSPPTGDIKKMVAEIFGKSHEEKEAEAKQAAVEAKADGGEPSGNREVPASESVRRSETAAVAENRNPIPEAANAEPDTGKACDENTVDFAARNNDAMQNEMASESPKRRHGSALPG